jgi:hypothetical protein
MALLNRTLERAQTAPRIRSALRVPTILPVAIGLIVVLGLVRIIQSSDATTTNYSIQDLEAQALEGRTVNSELASEIAYLSALDRIAREAGEMGFIEPEEQHTLSVNAPPPVVAVPGAGRSKSPEEAEQGDDSGWFDDILDLLPFR